MADDKRQTLDIPLGTTFEFKDGKLVFGHETDIVIRTNLGGYKFQKIFSKRGNVQVLPPEGVEFDVDEIEAPNGDVFLNGRVRAKLTRARTVHFQEGQLTADVIEAKDEIVLSGARINAFHVKSPKVTIDPDADGTILVIEAQNEVGRTRARGAFRSVAEARAAMDNFRRLFGDTPGAAGAFAAPAAGVSAPAGPPPSAATAAPAPIAQVSVDDANQTYPGMPVAGADSPALPKSSVFRKRS
jgi:hypothetical protein